MSNNKFLIFQIFALIAALVLAAVVGFNLITSFYNQREAEMFELKSEFNKQVTGRNYSRVEEMIKETPELVNLPLAKNAREYAESINDDTPLIAAGTDVKMVRLLIDYGADVNAPTPISHRYPITSLLASNENDRFDVAWLYISKGADVSCHDYVNGTFPYAILASKGIVRQTLQEAAAELMEYAVRKGVSLEAPTKPHSAYNSPLGLAAQNNYYIVIEYLALNKVLDLNARLTEDNKTALMIAAKCGNLAACDYLVYYGAKEGLKDDHGRSAYNYAMESGDTKTVAFFK